MVYISPVPVNDEMLQYYSKLLGLKTAIDSGNVEDQADLSDRYRILTPEAINSFPVSYTSNPNPNPMWRTRQTCLTDTASLLPRQSTASL